MTTPVTDDLIDRLVGLVPGSRTYAARHQREKAGWVAAGIRHPFGTSDIETKLRKAIGPTIRHPMRARRIDYASMRVID